MMQTSTTWIWAYGLVFLVLHLFAGVAIFIKRNDLADIFWGLGFIVAGLGALASLHFQTDSRGLIALVLVSFWGIRLAYHIGTRFFKNGHEDARYVQFRKDWGDQWIWKSYVVVWLMQGFLLCVIASPLVFVIGERAGSMDPISWVGVGVWAFGFAFESTSDRQLKNFRENKANKGRIMNEGLWSWSRHPNYFGEVVQWWGLFLLAATLPNGWMTIISPLLISFLILKVSGVPMLEKMMEDRPGFAEYKKKTSLFFPLPPRD